MCYKKDFDVLRNVLVPNSTPALTAEVAIESNYLF